MANLGGLYADLGVDTTGLRNAEREMRNFETAANASFGKVQNMASSSLSGMAGLVGVTLSVAGAFYAVERAVHFGIDAMEKFRISTIQIGSGLTNMAKEGQGSFREMFQRNYQFAKEMHEEIRKEDAKRFASSEDLMTSYNALVQKGYAVRLDEVDALGVLTDKIKLSTAGQNTSLQLNQEIRSLMDGQARAGSLLAVELKDKLGPGWSAIVEKERQAGNLLKFLADLWPGISAATEEVEKTLEAQYTTLQGNLKAIGRDGMEGAYYFIVDILRDINDYLRENERIIKDDIIAGWVTVKYTIDGISSSLRTMNSATSMNIPNSPDQRTLGQSVAKGWAESFSPGNWVSALASSSKFMWDEMWAQTERAGQSYMSLTKKADMLLESIRSIAQSVESSSAWNFSIDMEGAKKDISWLEGKVSWLVDIFSRVYTWTVNVAFSGLPSWFGGGEKTPQLPARNLTMPDTSLAKSISDAQKKSRGIYDVQLKQFGLTEIPAWAFPGMMPGQTISKQRPGKGAGGGGGRGAEAEINRLNSLFDTLTKDIARLSEGKLAEIEANYIKTVEQIYKKTSDRVKTEAEVEALAKQRSILQKTKLQEEFDLKMAKGSGDAFLEIETQYKKDLQDYNGLVGAKEKIDIYYGKQKLMAEVDRASQILNLNKTFIDTMAGLTPMMEDQLILKRKSLDLENELAQAAITKLIAENKHLAYLEDDLRARQALMSQAKKFNLEMESNKGLAGWAYGREKEIDQRNQIKDMVSGAEGWMGQTFGDAMVNAMQGKKMDLKLIWQDIMADVMRWSMKQAMQNITDFGARAAGRGQGQMSFGRIGGLGGAPGRGGGAPEGDTIAKQWEGVANRFDLGIGQFSDSTTSYQNAASSQSQSSDILSMAGAQAGVSAVSMGLSAVGLLTGSQFLMQAGMYIQVAATVLQVAALALEIAAAVDAIPFLHGGGIIAHRGWLVAHSGLNLGADERGIIAQVGEGVLQNRAMDKWARAGVSFDTLNHPTRLPALGGGNQGGSGVVLNLTSSPTINALDGTGVEQVLTRHKLALIKVIKRELDLNH